VLREQLPPGRDVRWCTEDQLHVTLKFLGDVADAQLPDVIAAIQQAAAQVAPFTIRLSGFGGFPTPRSPRVLWCGIEDEARGCARWVEVADPALADLGFAPEERAYTPHITLGRSKGPGGAGVMRGALEQLRLPESGEMLVDEIVLFESRLSPRGAQYLRAAVVPLGA